MQELVIFFLIAFVIVTSLLLKSSYSFDDPPSERHSTNYALEYNIKYHEFPALYIDHHFGSASGGNRIQPNY